MVCQNTTRARNGYQGKSEDHYRDEKKNTVNSQWVPEGSCYVGSKMPDEAQPPASTSGSGATSEFEIVSFCTSNKGAKQVGDGLDH